MCEKEKLRDVFIGLYAEVLWLRAAQDDDVCSSRGFHDQTMAEILKRIEKRKARIFPKNFEATYVTVSHSPSILRSGWTSTSTSSRLGVNGANTSAK